MIPRGAKKRKREFVRQNGEKYLKFGFTVAPGNEQCPQSLCLVCSQILSNDARKPSKLIPHFHSKHNNLKGKPLEYFEPLLSEINPSKEANEKNNLYRLICSSCFISHFISNSENKKKVRDWGRVSKAMYLNRSRRYFGTKTSQNV